MNSIQQLGKHFTLSNCVLTRVDIATDHHYFVNNDYFISVTRVIDIGGPFPEALRQWLRNTDAVESQERMEFTRDRGVKLHRALEELYLGWEIHYADFPTEYEKEAITSFIRTMRFLQPKEWKTEMVVADPVRRVAGTLDLWVLADKRKIDMLLQPTKYLDMYPSHLAVKEKYKDMLEGEPEYVSAIIDYKFTGRNTYGHKVQVGAYKHMFNLSYKGKLPKAKYAYTWRYSASHKNRFDMQQSLLPYKSFSRIFETAIEYLGSFPEAPTMNIYPDSVKLFDEIGGNLTNNNES